LAASARTEAGLNYYERARRSIVEADEAELAVCGAGTSLTGKVRMLLQSLSRAFT
jgi:DNA-binding transcriptional LysR family regulator